jgi:hypothetical protein
MDIGILGQVEPAEPVDHRLRLLGRRCVVEPDQRTAVDALAQDREITPNRLGIEPASGN